MEQDLQKDSNNTLQEETPSESTIEIDNALQAKIAELEQKYEQLQDQYLRARADLDNARKRFLKDKEEVRIATIQTVLGEVINVFDVFKIGLANVENRNLPRDILEGFQSIIQQFKMSLDRLGVVSLEPKEEPFNPHLHEAVSMCHDSTMPDGHIVRTIRNGYQWGDKLLRPASVVVSKGKAPEEPNDNA